VVAAVGRRNTLTADMVKPGAIVIDVGMNRDDERQAVRRRRFRRRAEVASHITPVPGGVGPMTITMLLMNTWKRPNACIAKTLERLAQACGNGPGKMAVANIGRNEQ
jgi:methylenetetrahydrofolate dehydrogenase (NADP+)/methenyltetrahydrofolate cyclohydrolase